MRKISALLFALVLLAWTHGSARAPTWWIDLSAGAGVDCTGVGDSASGVQSVFNSLPANYAVGVPLGCIVSLNSGITITNTVGVKLFSFARVQNSSVDAPTFVWNSNGSGPMFNFLSVDHPTVQGLAFKVAGGKTVGSGFCFLNFDTAAVPTQTATQPRIEQNIFDASNQTTNNFTAICNSLTSQNNNEHLLMQDNDVFCSGSRAIRRALDGSISNGSPNLTATASPAFSGADVGARVRVTWGTGTTFALIDTTILSVTDGTHVVMNANAPATMSNVTVHTGQAYGIGFHNGNSPNAKHQTIYRNTFTQCATAIQIDHGSFEINFQAGTFNDLALGIGSLSEPSTIANYEDEIDLRMIAISVGMDMPLSILSARLVLQANRADGFIYCGGQCRIIVQAANPQQTLQTNAVMFAFNQAVTTVMTAISNAWENNTFAQVNYATASSLTVLCDTGIDNNYGAAGCSNRFTNLPTSSTGLASGTMWNNSGVLNVK